MPSLRPGITVVVPFFNREASLPEMLESIRVQTRRPEAVIFIDNNSSDSSSAIVREWSDARISEGWDITMESENRQGAAAARKKGERLARTRYLSFFDSDDMMRPDFIRKAMQDFEADPQLVITAWNVEFHNPEGLSYRRRIHSSRPLENHLVQGLLSTQAYAVDTDYLRSAGGWTPEIGGWDDLELGLRLLSAGGKIKITDEVRADITVQEDSISGLGYRHRRNDWEHTLDVMENFAYSLPNNRKILKLLSYRRAILAAHYQLEGDPDASKSLLCEALAHPKLSSIDKFYIRSAHLFTSLGLPGAGSIFPRLL